MRRDASLIKAYGLVCFILAVLSTVLVFVLLFSTYQPSLPPGYGRRGGLTGAGTKRPYTLLLDVVEDSWLAHHNTPLNTSSDVLRPSSSGNGTFRLSYVGVLARHGARYPTARKLKLSKAAAKWICDITDGQHSQEGRWKEAQDWCTWMLASLDGVQGGGLNSFGEWEQREFGREIAKTYFPSSSTSSSSAGPCTPASASSLPASTCPTLPPLPTVSVSVTAKARTKQSCRAFWDGVYETVLPSSFDAQQVPAPSSADAPISAGLCDAAEAEAEGLLRPYTTCLRVQRHRKAVVDGLYDPRTIKAARRALLENLDHPSLPYSSVPSDDIVLGVFYACQTAFTLVDPSPSSQEQTPPDQPFPPPSRPDLACSLLSSSSSPLPSPLEALEATEDTENYQTRGFGPASSKEVMAPFLRHLTQRMENRGGGAEAQRPLMIDLFFAHDSTVLPVVALLDLVRLGPHPHGAARLCPFSSRLAVERWERMSEEDGEAGDEDKEASLKRRSQSLIEHKLAAIQDRQGVTKNRQASDRIVLRYNGFLLKIIEGGLAEWKEVYADALLVRHEEVCNVPASQLYPSPNEVEEDL